MRRPSKGWRPLYRQHARLWRGVFAGSADPDDAVAEAFAQALRRGQELITWPRTSHPTHLCPSWLGVVLVVACEPHAVTRIDVHDVDL